MSQEITIKGLERFTSWWALVGTLGAGVVGLVAMLHWFALALAKLLGAVLPEWLHWGYSYWFWEGLSVLAGAAFAFGLVAAAVGSLCVSLGTSDGGGVDPAERRSGGMGGRPHGGPSPALGPVSRRCRLPRAREGRRPRARGRA
ncbi:hypothetical protein APR52_39805 [Variovorax paradoxus]|nr:hypothetical protein APR52_39805 [Variovorax paradoxus]KPV33550.1 hypothetical protein APR47_17150 [Variovorax paradoxus]